MSESVYDLLTNLHTYRPRENTDPLENFVTEAFAWLLRSDSEHGILRDFIDFLVLHDKKQREKSHKKPLLEELENNDEIWNGEIKIDTQVTFDNGKRRPDMVIYLKGIALVFEHKIWASLHQDQLGSYKGQIKNKENRVINDKIVLITGKDQPNQNPDAKLYWREIYEFLECLEKEPRKQPIEPVTKWGVKSFMKLLNDVGLGPQAPVNAKDIADYRTSFKRIGRVEERLLSLVSVVRGEKEHLFPFLRPEKTESQKFSLDTNSRKRWGRIGLNFISSYAEDSKLWLPAIFFGFLVDPYDHGADDLLKDETNEEEIKLMVTISFEKALHGSYDKEKMPHFNSFVNKLKEVLENDENLQVKWTLHDRYNDHEHYNDNRWHPVIIISSMKEFFVKLVSHKEQVNGFYQEIEKLQNIMLEDCGTSFRAFLDETHKKYDEITRSSSTA